MKIEHIIETERNTDAEGNVTETTLEKTRKREKNDEPDYIKIYTNMWCEFNSIPIAYRQLFLSLATRMTYCNTKDLQNSQLVYTGTPWRDAIMEECNWTSRDSLMKGLKILCDCNAIKKIGRGVYQINPSYAGKGKWVYDPQAEQGGVRDLIATFNFKDKEIETKIIWADDGKNEELNKIYREGLNASKEEKTILKTRNIKNKREA